MMRAKTGRILFLSSVVGEMGNVGQTAYAASKAALIGAAKSIAREFATRNITVNAIAPGFIETELTADMEEPRRSATDARIPMGRWGVPEDVAGPVSWLLSDDARYVTGAVIPSTAGSLRAENGVSA